MNSNSNSSPYRRDSNVKVQSSDIEQFRIVRIDHNPLSSKSCKLCLYRHGPSTENFNKRWSTAPRPIPWEGIGDVDWSEPRRLPPTGGSSVHWLFWTLDAIARRMQARNPTLRNERMMNTKENPQTIINSEAGQWQRVIKILFTINKTPQTTNDVAKANTPQQSITDTCASTWNSIDQKLLEG